MIDKAYILEFNKDLLQQKRKEKQQEVQTVVAQTPVKKKLIPLTSPTSASPVKKAPLTTRHATIKIMQSPMKQERPKFANASTIQRFSRTSQQVRQK